MTKSTPMHTLQQQSNTGSSPSIQYVETSIEPQVNVEQVMHDKSFEDNRHQTQLQDQIDLLKMQLSTNSTKPPTSEHISQNQPSTKDSLINKHTLMYLGNNFDYKLFGVIFVLSILIYSSSIREYIFAKLEIRNLAYLQPYILAGLLSIGVVTMNKI